MGARVSEEVSNLRVGMSPCPNDTFMFHGIVHGRVSVPGIHFEAVMADIEALNERAMGEARLPITKLSASAAFELGSEYVVLSAGAALGRGCGPLVVRRSEHGDLERLDQLSGSRVAIPGDLTTANLLLRLFAAGFQPVKMRFDEIMPAVELGVVDAGVIIHESRFTYAQHGLVQIADLGEHWETDTGLPIPLGVICASRSLGARTIAAVEEGLRRSVEAAFDDPGPAWPWIREHAQEMDESVCRAHIDLYVNEFSRDLGDEGRAALQALLERARARGVIDDRRRSPLD
jgi:1,4-dihydroxy-6-naphthoate synthase